MTRAAPLRTRSDSRRRPVAVGRRRDRPRDAARRARAGTRGNREPSPRIERSSCATCGLSRAGRRRRRRRTVEDEGGSESTSAATRKSTRLGAVAFVTEYAAHGPVRVAVGVGADGESGGRAWWR